MKKYSLLLLLCISLNTLSQNKINESYYLEDIGNLVDDFYSLLSEHMKSSKINEQRRIRDAILKITSTGDTYFIDYIPGKLESYNSYDIRTYINSFSTVLQSVLNNYNEEKQFIYIFIDNKTYSVLERQPQKNIVKISYNIRIVNRYIENNEVTLCYRQCMALCEISRDSKNKIITQISPIKDLILPLKHKETTSMPIEEYLNDNDHIDFKSKHTPFAIYPNNETNTSLGNGTEYKKVKKNSFPSWICNNGTDEQLHAISYTYSPNSELGLSYSYWASGFEYGLDLGVGTNIFKIKEYRQSSDNITAGDSYFEYTGDSYFSKYDSKRDPYNEAKRKSALFYIGGTFGYYFNDYMGIQLGLAYGASKDYLILKNAYNYTELELVPDKKEISYEKSKFSAYFDDKFRHGVTISLGINYLIHFNEWENGLKIGAGYKYNPAVKEFNNFYITAGFFFF